MVQTNWRVDWNPSEGWHILLLIFYLDGCMKSDERIISFEYLNGKMPLVFRTRFNEGIMCHAAATVHERGHSKGSFGGYRST